MDSILWEEDSWEREVGGKSRKARAAPNHPDAVDNARGAKLALTYSHDTGTSQEKHQRKMQWAREPPKATVFPRSLQRKKE